MMVYCIALDPGGTTGMVIVRDKHEPWRIGTKEITGAHYLELHSVLASLHPMTIVCETFENRADEAARIISAEYIGVVKCYQQIAHCKLVMQAPAAAKTFWSNQKLQDYGLWAEGKRHARDAVRHYAYWQTFKVGDKSLLERKATPYVVPIVAY
jgi:hypothetical protein